jgi:hypothetical protein
MAPEIKSPFSLDLGAEGNFCQVIAGIRENSAAGKDRILQRGIETTLALAEKLNNSRTQDLIIDASLTLVTHYDVLGLFEKLPPGHKLRTQYNVEEIEEAVRTIERYAVT